MFYTNIHPSQTKTKLISVVELDIPTVFPSNILSGFTKINQNIDPDLKKGLNFRISEKDHYLRSLDILSQSLNTSSNRFKIPIQSHSDEVLIVDRYSNTDSFDGDALISNDAEVILGSKSADCCIVLLLDPLNKVFASIHSGRSGTEKNITKKVVSIMKTKFGSNPKDILAYLSTSASKEMYPVYKSQLSNWPSKYIKLLSEDHIYGLTNQNKAILEGFIIRSDSDPNYLVDIKRWIVDQLLESDLSTQNIEVSQICSISNTQYHSQRRNPNHFGNALGFIGFKTLNSKI